ncbi:MAG: zinc-binding alcohol dehydrogenase [Anaerolineae bacterium]|nr:MAG: zinc-binding alcohol dehydrogenase [Anaerolineae bacterium]
MASELRALVFTGEHQMRVAHEPIRRSGAGEVLVATRLSAISAGTELLVYRNQMPDAMDADSTIAGLSGVLAYPLRYGYCSVGEVGEIGTGIDKDWLGKRVFSFQPHASHFVTRVEELIPIPDGVSFDDAVFLPNVETAVNFVLDGRPMLGEKVCVIGQGVVGLLTTAVVGRFPLRDLLVLDGIEMRRERGLAFGAQVAFEPSQETLARERLAAGAYDGADLVFEVSGSPVALDMAIRLTGFSGRVIVGSWYGNKRANLDLGGAYHRKRIQLVSSQVSTVTPELSGRWGKARRFETAWEMVANIRPSQLITHRFNLEEAQAAYVLLDQTPEKALQVVFEY